MRPIIITPPNIVTSIPMETREFNFAEYKYYIVQYLFDMPGVLKSNINVTITTDPAMLTVSCDRVCIEENNSSVALISEIKYGMMSRQVMLPENVIAYTASSRYIDGALYVNFKMRKTSLVFGVKIE
jgi:HSP20 family molecular chaperone IbpA